MIMPRRFSKTHFSNTRAAALCSGDKPSVNTGGGYNNLGFFGKEQFSYSRTRTVGTISQCASFLFLNGRFESSSFPAERFTANNKYEFALKNKVISTRDNDHISGTEPVEVNGNHSTYSIRKPCDRKCHSGPPIRPQQSKHTNSADKTISPASFTS